MLDNKSQPKAETFPCPRGWLTRWPFRARTPYKVPDARFPALRQSAIQFPGVLRGKSGAIGRAWRVILALLPTILAILYFGPIASDRYVSETKFVVRTAAQGFSGIGSFLQMTGLAR